jgi:hypothetical protein
MNTAATATVSTARAARLAAIVAGAEVRAALGQGATYELLSDGRHRVRLRQRVGIGATVAEAIDQIYAMQHGGDTPS